LSYARMTESLYGFLFSRKMLFSQT